MSKYATPTILQINVNENCQTAEICKVKSMPTFQLYKGGEVIEQVSWELCTVENICTFHYGKVKSIIVNISFFIYHTGSAMVHGGSEGHQS